MFRIRSLAIAVLALVAVSGAGVAQPASASWAAHDVATAGPARVDDIDGLPNGRPATLLTRSTGKHQSALELWIGRRHTVVVTSAHALGAATMGHDARGRVVVVFARAGSGDDDGKVYAWTAAQGAQLLAIGFNSISDSLGVAVAPSGRAGVTFSLYGKGTHLARGTTTAGFTSAPQTLPSSSPAISSEVGIADNGTATVAYNRTWLGRARWGAPPVAARLPTETLPGSSDLGDFALAVTDAGRAVIGLHTYVDLPTGRQDTVSISTWDPAAAAPSPLVNVYNGHGGRLVAVAARNTAYVVWRAQARQNPVTGVGAATVTPDGAIHHRFTIPGGGAGDFQSRRLAIAPSGTGARVYLNAGGGIHTSRIDRSATLAGTTVVTGSGEANPLVSATEADGRPIIAWTHYLDGTESESRVRIARPR